jgi:hypothetical protein
MLTLRGHHLICLHFFNGEGYSAEFIEHLGNMIKKAENTNIKICTGADDVCIKCPYLKNGRCEYNKNADDEIREMDNTALKLLGLVSDSETSWMETKKRILKIFPEWYKSYCRDCVWRKSCEKNTFFQEECLLWQS